jgi:hypothetical protein
MSNFLAVTDSDLARARTDPVFRQKLLTESLEILLATIKRQRKPGQPARSSGDTQLREGVELAVRLAELIQSADNRYGRT